MGLAKILLTTLKCALVTLLFFNAACTNLEISSLKNNSENATVPSPKKTPVIIDGRLINEAGWKVPQTKDTRTGNTEVKTINSVEGKPFKVKTTYFTPNNPVFYTEELFSENVTRLRGELLLIHFEEFRLNDKVYLYSITANENESISQKNVNAHNEILIYQILDNDGDGIFETLIDDYKTVPIPKWATEKR